MKPFVPDVLPIEGLDTAKLICLVGPATAAIARYDGLLQGVVNPAVMLSPLTNREAVLSSKIEGTQTTVDEVLEYEAGIEFEKNKVQDIQEVVNYRKTLTLASETLENRPISLSLLKEMHNVLMDSVRGERKSPGAFRTTQNFLGAEGSTIGQAKFVPPSPLQLLDHLEAWENYVAGDDIDTLIQCAVVHAQFEILHPFSDGNGRIGRLLIPLFLFQKKALASPMFYLSEYLEAHRDEYYTRLRAISNQGDWTGWVEFFLQAIRAQALQNTQQVHQILELYEQMKKTITDVTHSQHAIKILDALFHRPIFQSNDFIQHSGIPRNTALPFLRKLREEGVLYPLREASGRKAAVFAFRDLLNCAEGRRVL